jgi:hypothetical protein
MTQLMKRSLYDSGLKGRFEVLGIPLYMLYRYAFIGKSSLLDDDSLYSSFYPMPILELKDSSLFQFDYFHDGKNLYCYSLIVPEIKASQDYLMGVMQNDLKNFFGYDVRVETRKMSYWRLVADAKWRSKLISKSDTSFVAGIARIEFIIRNRPIKNIINFLAASFQNGPPFIDETGINENIDLTIHALVTDFDEIKASLNENGLDLVKGEKEMKVIVIRDPKK